ncbi:unnamed protein product [Peniophora sp. CBMAI 1063]|nr:unnamed protein product [Peniophora sp. CBMAI 1063]
MFKLKHRRLALLATRPTTSWFVVAPGAAHEPGLLAYHPVAVRHRGLQSALPPTRRPSLEPHRRRVVELCLRPCAMSWNALAHRQHRVPKLPSRPRTSYCVGLALRTAAVVRALPQLQISACSSGPLCTLPSSSIKAANYTFNVVLARVNIQLCFEFHSHMSAVLRDLSTLGRGRVPRLATVLAGPAADCSTRT